MRHKLLSSAAAAALCVLTAAQADARPNYLRNIPAAPGSCGACHISPGGGGARNPFGVAFQDNGIKWDATLCAADSDGDGASNGVELGDPNCMWMQGDAATTAVSNPGDNTSKPPEQMPDMGMDMAAEPDMAVTPDMAVEPDMGGEPADMGGEPADMGVGEDMAAQPDMSSGADMSAPPIRGDDDDDDDDEGCAQAGLSGKGAGAPALLLGLFGLIGLARRRR
jgi:dopamine beta-monooxygenase